MLLNTITSLSSFHRQSLKSYAILHKGDDETSFPWLRILKQRESVWER